MSMKLPAGLGADDTSDWGTYTQVASSLVGLGIGQTDPPSDPCPEVSDADLKNPDTSYKNAVLLKWQKYVHGIIAMHKGRLLEIQNEKAELAAQIRVDERNRHRDKKETKLTADEIKDIILTNGRMKQLTRFEQIEEQYLLHFEVQKTHIDSSLRLLSRSLENQKLKVGAYDQGPYRRQSKPSYTAVKTEEDREPRTLNHTEPRGPWSKG